MYISEEKKELARQYTMENCQNGCNCSESVWYALLRAGIIDMPLEYARYASALNGGVAGSGNVCGAIAGCMMALGAVYGRRNAKEIREEIIANPEAAAKPTKAEDDWRFNYFRRYNAAVDEFKQITGTCSCQEVMDKSGGYYGEVRLDNCIKMIQTGTEVALKYLEMEQEEADKLPYGPNCLGWK